MNRSSRGVGLSVKSPFSSPRTPRTPTTNPRRTLLSASVNKNSSRYSVSGRSNQSVQVIYQSLYHVVESFGAPVPVMVTEALAFADRSSTVSVRLSTSGWAWFVCGRQLLVWQYRQDSPGRWAPGSQCRELALPPSDLAHRAQLVTVFMPERANVPSCIAVSPEGAVRYWASIAHEGKWIEENADLQGQECDSLGDMTPVGCILATTTSTICVVTPQASGGQNVVTCRTLRTAQGWLGGIGRRVSSIFFASMPSAQSLETRLVKVVTVPEGPIECRLMMLAGQSLQRWQLSAKEPERMLFDCDVNRLVREAFIETMWQETDMGNAQELQTWLLDMQAMEEGVMLLVAAANLNNSPQLYYALALLPTENGVAPERLQMFLPLKIHGIYRGEESELEGLNFQFLLTGLTALIYNQKQLLAVGVNNHREDPDRIELVGPGDCILGGAMCDKTPVFFTRSHGLVSISPSDQGNLDLLNNSISFSEAPSMDHLSMAHHSDSANLSLTGATIEELAVDSDISSRLKAAFVYFNRREIASCQTILEEMFPMEYERTIDIDAPVDLVVVRVSQDIVNDMPAADPRWAETHTIGTGISTSSSLQIMQQLHGKQQTIELFVHFLKSVNLWRRLSAVTVRGIAMATAHVLQEHAEKITAAIVLRNLLSKNSDLLDGAIKASLKARNLKPTGGLTYHDLFFREVTQIHEVPQQLRRWCKDLVHSDKPPKEVATLLKQVNSIILEIFQEIIQMRKQRVEVFCPDQGSGSDLIEYLPWTAAPGEGGLRDTLFSQLKLSVRFGIRQSSGDVLLRTALSSQVQLLADHYLNGYQCHLESLRGGEKQELLSQQYEIKRLEAIQPLVEEEAYDEAITLAEKYLDFQTLIQLCEKTNNKERLESYIDKFAEHNFSEFLFGWYMKEGKQDKLLRLFGGTGRPMQHQQALVGFLSQHPHLAWLQALQGRQYASASNTLQKLASEETEFLARKKSMLSLAKLSMLASDELLASIESNVCNIDSELDLVGMQENLPDNVMNQLGLDADNMSVLPPSRLIRMYVGPDNDGANLLDFKKALDLLEYINEDSEKEYLKLHIWCQAVLRDNWEDLNTDAPVEACKDLLFFKLMDLMNLHEFNVSEVLVPLEQILEAPELGSLTTNNTYRFLMRIGYEHMATCMDSSSE